MNTKNNLFVVGTPFQLINAVNFVLNSDDNESFDLVIRNWRRYKFSENWNSILNELFDNIIIIKQAEDICNIKRKGLRILQFAAPSCFLNCISDVPGIISQKNRYDRIFCSTVAGISPVIIRMNKPACVNFYDDGTGSYAGNIVTKEPKLDLRIYKFLGKMDLRIVNPTCLYVNNSRLCTATFPKEIKELPSLITTIQKHRNVIEGLFNKCKVDYSGYQIVYLDQSYTDMSRKQEMERCRDEMLAELDEERIIYRLHPKNISENMVVSDGNYIVDDTNYPWELLCADKINNRHILIGDCSTAQIAPKWFLNKEPYVIFLFHYTEQYWSSDMLDAFKQIVEKTKAAYKNKEKVICVDNPRELKSVLNRIIQN